MIGKVDRGQLGDAGEEGVGELGLALGAILGEQSAFDVGGEEEVGVGGVEGTFGDLSARVGDGRGEGFGDEVFVVALAEGGGHGHGCHRTPAPRAGRATGSVADDGRPEELASDLL